MQDLLLYYFTFVQVCHHSVMLRDYRHLFWPLDFLVITVLYNRCFEYQLNCHTSKLYAVHLLNLGDVYTVVRFRHIQINKRAHGKISPWQFPMYTKYWPKQFFLMHVKNIQNNLWYLLDRNWTVKSC